MSETSERNTHEPGAETPPKQAAFGRATPQTRGRRELFWQNVVREILSALSVTAAAYAGRLKPTAGGAAMTPAPDHDLFDGRMAVITRLGQRIPIADVYPVFACSLASHKPAQDRMLAADVQCSIFQIRTPSGEIYTLPVHEIASVHALSESLIRQMQQAAQSLSPSDTPDSDAPFGFAAFTSLAQSERETSESDDSSV